MQALMEQAAQMTGTAFGEALTSTTLAGALDSFEKLLGEQIYNAALGGLTDAFLQTEIFEQKMAPLMATMAEAFGPDISTKERRALLESLISQTQKISTSPEMQDLVETGWQMQEILRQGLLGIPASVAASKISHVPALAMAEGGTLPENVYGVGPSGRRYVLHEGEDVVPAGRGGGEVHIHLEGAVIADEMSLEKLARKIKVAVSRIDGRVH
jgi:hypothetical protein